MERKGDLIRSMPKACQSAETKNWMKRFFTELPSLSAKWSNAAATAVLRLYSFGSVCMITCVSTWLWWFEAKITGASFFERVVCPVNSQRTLRTILTSRSNSNKIHLQQSVKGERNCFRMASASGGWLALCSWDVICVIEYFFKRVGVLIK